jgi:hypothetical protein
MRHHATINMMAFCMADTVRPFHVYKIVFDTTG